MLTEHELRRQMSRDVRERLADDARRSRSETHRGADVSAAFARLTTKLRRSRPETVKPLPVVES